MRDGDEERLSHRTTYSIVQQNVTNLLFSPKGCTHQVRPKNFRDRRLSNLIDKGPDHCKFFGDVGRPTG